MDKNWSNQIFNFFPGFIYKFYIVNTICNHLPFGARLSTFPDGCGTDGSRIHDRVRPHSGVTCRLADRHFTQAKLTSPSSTHRRARAQLTITAAQSEPDHDNSEIREVMFTPAVQQSVADEGDPSWTTMKVETRTAT